MPTQMPDYLANYVGADGFDIPRLLNDDFFLAIKHLYNAKYYVSATKLLMSFIDTMAFLESGEAGGPPFKKWLDAHVELAPLAITSEEVWEHRNSLLHMTSLNSRKVCEGRVRRLVAYVGRLPPDSPSADAEAKWFDLYALIQAVAGGLPHYITSMQSAPESRGTFIERYDQMVSDTRVMSVTLPDVG